MTSVLETLREEHRNIARVLNAMENQLERLAAASNPDYDLLQTIANYQDIRLKRGSSEIWRKSTETHMHEFVASATISKPSFVTKSCRATQF